MNQNNVKLLLGMDLRDIETQIVFQCAPVIAGLKASNLLIIKNDDVCYMKKIIDKTNLSYYMLFTTDKRTTILIYDKSLLKKYLSQERVIRFLKDTGYENCRLKKLLPVYKSRYERYKTGVREFPHEIGILLGYPIEDVEGFIKNKGKNSLYTGYWKVYEALPEKIHLFSAFESARETFIQMLIKGYHIDHVKNLVYTVPRS